MQVVQGFTVSLFICLLFDGISETASLRHDPCPKRGIHRSWYESGCTKCNCVKNGFECYSCGSTHIFKKQECYIRDLFPLAKFPLCCKKEVICRDFPGDEGTKCIFR